MDTTATTQLQRYGTGEARQLESKHNEHDPEKNHSNKTIQPDETPMNTHQIVTGSLDDTLELVWGDKIAEDNAKLLQQKTAGVLSDYNYKKRVKTVESYCGGKKKPVMNFVSTLGNVETTRQLMDRMGIKYEMRDYTNEFGDLATEPHVLPEDQQRWSAFCNSAFEKYADYINTNTAFQVSQYWTHLDEGGAPHIHIETVTAGHTKGGKLSQNPNNAIRDTLTALGEKTTNDTRSNLSKFRKATDEALVAVFNQTAKEQGYDVDLNLVRTGRPGGQSMEDYKKQQAQQAKVEKQAEKNKALSKVLKDKEAKLNQQEKAIKDAQSSLKQKQQQVDDVVNAVIDFANTKRGGKKVDNLNDAGDVITDWVSGNRNAVHSTVKRWQQLQQQMKQAKEEQAKRDAELKRREDAVKQQEMSLKELLERFKEWAKEALFERFQSVFDNGMQQQREDDETEREIAQHEADNEYKFGDTLEDMTARDVDNEDYSQTLRQRKQRNRQERIEEASTVTNDDVVRFTTHQKYSDQMAKTLGGKTMTPDTAKLNNQIEKQAKKKDDELEP